VIFRINDDGSTPIDNPFSPQADLANYFAYGIRNGFGLAFDPLSGDLWDTENGPNAYDEINLVLPGFNSGWEQIMGPDSRDPQGVGNLVSFPGSHYADPKFSWFNPVGPTAILFFNSSQLGTQYQNDVFVGDINNGNLYHFKPNSTQRIFVFRPSVGGLGGGGRRRIRRSHPGHRFRRNHRPQSRSRRLALRSFFPR
jgi:glucose/arabinose dehydrogenase